MANIQNNQGFFTKENPFLVIEGGDIVLHGFDAMPLKGFTFKEGFPTKFIFYNSVLEKANEWFEKFPDCCEPHKRLKLIFDLKKEDYEDVPMKIVKQLAYTEYHLETFIDSEDWYELISEYFEYMFNSFGSPSVGGHIFVQGLEVLLNNITFDKKEFPEEKKNELLKLLKPEKVIENQNIDLNALHRAFQKWLKYMPPIGQFKDLKNRLTDKIPMNLFLYDFKYNRYTGLSKSRVKTIPELIDFLMQMTIRILSTIDTPKLLSENIITIDEKTILEIAGEKLRVQQKKLLEQSHLQEELKYIEIVESWLQNELEYYDTVNRIIGKQSDIIKKLENIELNTSDILNAQDLTRIELADLQNNLQEIQKKIEQQLPDEELSAAKHIQDDIDKLNFEENLKEITNVIENVNNVSNQNQNIKNDEVKKALKKLNDSDISIKHKLKLSIPLFFLFRYEAELEFNNKQVLPKSWEEFKNLFLES